MQYQTDLTVIIVNYNTKEHLRNCLDSIYQSKQDVSYEVWVVDNNSTDHSHHMVKKNFPQINLIRNQTNEGFAKANNQVLRRASTEFVLLLNPDTIVFDNVFDTTIQFLRKTPEAGMATCKLVKADGMLDLACRRSFPSAFDGFCRAIGLSKYFPTSRLFARYNLTYLAQDKISEVDAINGAFMMVKTEAIRDVGLMDESYFMYMEDLDWCFRFINNGWKTFYVPLTKIIHLKGESGKKYSNQMIQEFFYSMEIFCKKNYFPNQSSSKRFLTLLGIRIWKSITLNRNRIRTQKTVTP